MHVLGISASPRRHGNSELVLDKALEGAGASGSTVEKIVLNELSFKGCQECGGCDKTGVCVIDDDMKLVYEKINSADAVIIASPIFFGSVSAQLKAMIDRFQCRWVAKYVLKKKDVADKRGIFLCVGASDRLDFFENARSIIRHLFATLNTEYTGDLFIAGMDNRSDVSDNKEALNKAFKLGASLAL